jgi:hypothetical protein
MPSITFDTLKFSAGEAELATVRDLRELGEITRHEIELVRRDLKDLEQRMTIKLGAMLVVAVSVVAALVKLL